MRKCCFTHEWQSFACPIYFLRSGQTHSARKKQEWICGLQGPVHLSLNCHLSTKVIQILGLKQLELVGRILTSFPFQYMHSTLCLCIDHGVVKLIRISISCFLIKRLQPLLFEMVVLTSLFPVAYTRQRQKISSVWDGLKALLERVAPFFSSNPSLFLFEGCDRSLCVFRWAFCAFCGAPKCV